MNKFQIIPINRHCRIKVKVGNNAHDFTKVGKVLGTLISETVFSSHITNRIKAAKLKLPLMFILKNLSMRNKRTLYTTLVISILEYPPIPLYTTSHTSARKMQTIQNKAARIITNTRKRERKTSKYVNEKANLIPINISLNKQAISIWQ